MIQRTGDDKDKTRQILGITFCLHGFQSDLLQQIVHGFVVLRGGKIVCKASGDHLSHSVDICQLFHGGVADMIQIVSKCIADHFGIGQSDIWDTKAVDKLCKCGLTGVFQSSDQFIVGTLAKAIHIDNGFPVVR